MLRKAQPKMNQQTTLIRQESDSAIRDWREQEKLALDLLSLTGELRFDRSIELVLFRQDIYDTRPSKVLDAHRLGIDYQGTPVSVRVTWQIAKAIHRFTELAPAKIDLGKLALEWEVQEHFTNLDEFVRDRLHTFTTEHRERPEPRDVVLYGFGRIGRLLARRIIDQTGRGEQLRLKAIVIRPKMKDHLAEARKRAALLQSDSVHGDFHGTVEVLEEGHVLMVNGNRVQLIYAGQPTDINYPEYGIQDAILIDNTGVWRDKEALSVHLRPGIDKVMLTAPAKGIPNVVHGVNHQSVDFEQQHIFCAASCTTNAIAPIIKLVDEAFGIEKGHIETIHAYTSDQNLLDNFHKKPRRGRGAATNMVLTSTGAAKAVAKVLPGLAGKLSGNAVRVPTPDVSLAILNLQLTDPTDRESLNERFLQASLRGDLVEQIHYSTSEEYVSTSAVGMTSTSVFDAPSTIVSADGKSATIYAWYDNEYGYACQVVRLAKQAAKVRRACYY
jgi:glyceraldehyde 3-phosphate dehydrogenase